MRVQNNTNVPVLIADISGQPYSISGVSGLYRDFYDTDEVAKSYAFGGLKHLIDQGTVSVVSTSRVVEGVNVGNISYIIANISGVSGYSGASGASGVSGFSGASGKSGFSGVSGI